MEKKTINWKQFIFQLLTESDLFVLSNSIINGQTEKEYFISTIRGNNSIFEVGYVSDSLMFLNLSNKDIPGYSKYISGEYFCDDEFDHKRQGKVGLSFDEINREGIRNTLKIGLNGKEEQYLVRDKIIYSKLFLNDHRFSLKFDFSGRNYWKRIFGPKIPNMTNIDFRIVELSKIFAGI